MSNSLNNVSVSLGNLESGTGICVANGTASTFDVTNVSKMVNITRTGYYKTYDISIASSTNSLLFSGVISRSYSVNNEPGDISYYMMYSYTSLDDVTMVLNGVSYDGNVVRFDIDPLNADVENCHLDPVNGCKIIISSR